MFSVTDGDQTTENVSGGEQAALLSFPLQPLALTLHQQQSDISVRPVSPPLSRGALIRSDRPPPPPPLQT